MLSLAVLGAVAAVKPSIVVFFADDLGWYDTSLHNNSAAPTPRIEEVAKEGMILDRHYVFRYCSPTRRAFLSSRFPNHITSVQPDVQNNGSLTGGFCTDFLPLAVTILSQKLKQAGYATHFVGKGHLGYQTDDHLPVNRGFDSHLGYLAGSEHYTHGGEYTDLWQDNAPAPDVAKSMNYSMNVYAARAVGLIEGTPKETPLYLHLMYQNVHSPYELPPAWEQKSCPGMWDATYGNMLHMLDEGVGNVTDALKKNGRWESTLVLFTSDNGGIGRGNNYPLRGHKHDPWEGGTRVVAFLSGGFLPATLKGTRSGDKLVHVVDWYPTFCGLAGVSAEDTVELGGKPRPIDGVDVWPLLTGSEASSGRRYTPTTEVSIVDTGDSEWYKLIVLAGQSQYYTPDQKKVAANDTCLTGHQPDPAEPGRTDPIVYRVGCPVCNVTQPCLYAILSDPYETRNIAGDNPDIVKRLTAELEAANDIYVNASLDDATLAANYTKIHHLVKHWGGYLGPCYLRKK